MGVPPVAKTAPISEDGCMNDHAPFSDNSAAISLNANAYQLCEVMEESADEMRVEIREGEGGFHVIDCGIDVEGGLAAGRLLAEICMADLGEVEIGRGDTSIWPGPQVSITTDHPVAACLASQYAGWKITAEGYFAMGSGPMRAVAGKEDLFDAIGRWPREEVAVGVLESDALPPDEVGLKIAEDCGVAPKDLVLLVAPTRSLAGTVQIVARSVETTLHKLHELRFDVSRVVSGFGSAPLPPPAPDQIDAIGRTNDAILYGGEVTLWVRGDEASIEEIGPQVPSAASQDHGLPFADVFRRVDGDFYQIDPLLFSPAVVTLISLDTGRSFRFGKTMPEVLRQSFGG